MNIGDGDMVSVRQAARDLYRLIERLHTGERERFVLVDRDLAIRAVLAAPNVPMATARVVPSGVHYGRVESFPPYVGGDEDDIDEWQAVCDCGWSATNKWPYAGSAYSDLVRHLNEAVNPSTTPGPALAGVPVGRGADDPEAEA